MSRYLGYLLLFSLVLLLAYTPSAGKEYTVEPGYDSIMNQTPHDFTPITFWELTPRAMLFEIMFILTQMVIVPVESLLPIKFFTYLGYRRISQKNVLGHRTRSMIYDCIAAQPGINFTALALETGVNRGTLRYHLKLLRLAGKIVVLDEGEGCTRYFQDSGRYSLFEQHVIKHLGSEVRTKIILHLLSHDAATRKEVRELVGISFPSVAWNMSRLCSDDMVVVERNGRSVSYRINPEARPVVKRFLEPSAPGPSRTDAEEDSHRQDVRIE